MFRNNVIYATVELVTFTVGQQATAFLARLQEGKGTQLRLSGTCAT